MADVKLLVPFILRWEGGFVNDPNDLGGATNRGVTFATYEKYCQKKALPQPSLTDLKQLTQEKWFEIMKSMYWDRWRGDEIKNQSVATILVDWVWTSGVYGIRIPQKILGVTADGIVGSRTITALNTYYSAAELFGRFKQARLDYIDAICEKRPENTKFLKGWKNRINALIFSS